MIQNLIAVFLLPVIMIAVGAVAAWRRRQYVVLDHPHAASLPDAQVVMDRLVAEGVPARLVATPDSGLTMWANTRAGGSVKLRELYVIQVPRRWAKTAGEI